jgi:phospholipase/carboxylesterase
MVLLHGFTGDENSMWIFARSLPGEYTLLAPRAPIAVPEGGYTWREMASASWGFPSIGDLRPAVDSLLSFLDSWSPAAGIRAETFDVMGFSQGAALTYALALCHPDRVRAVAALSGFLPLGAETLLAARPLSGKRLFIAHGTQDERIPVERARNASKRLEESGALVTYCESPTGHKVDKDCLRGMSQFFISGFG